MALVLTFPAFVQDGARALAWVQRNISSFGGDLDQVFVMGHSAGAYIAAMLTLDERYLVEVDGGSSWIKGMIGLAGPYDFLPLKSDELKAISGPPDAYAASQPINFVDGNEPPMLLLHGQQDRTVLVRNSKNLAAKIAERGGAVKTVLYPDLGHGIILGALAPAFRKQASVLEEILAFVRFEAAALHTAGVRKVSMAAVASKPWVQFPNEFYCVMLRSDRSQSVFLASTEVASTGSCASVIYSSRR